MSVLIEWDKEKIESFVKANYKQGMSAEEFAKLFSKEDFDKYRIVTTY